MARYFSIPWATTGDRVSYPNVAQVDGSASYPQGFGYDYEREDTDPLYKPVPRDGMNGVLFELTEAVGEIQKYGAALWQAAAAPYPLNALVYHGATMYRSTVANNSAAPGADASWIALSSVPGATTGQAGVIRIATAAETSAGILGDVAVPPSALKPLLDAKAPIASPVFTGTPRTPSPPTSDSSERIANTFWVRDWWNSIVGSVQAALGFMPVQQGGGAGQANNKIYLGWDGGGLRAQVDATPQGQIFTDLNGDGKIGGYGYIKSASQAGVAVGSVGSYAYCTYLGAGTITPGTLLDGASLRYASNNGYGTVVAPGTTWQCMGWTQDNKATLWLRTA